MHELTYDYCFELIFLCKGLLRFIILVVIALVRFINVSCN